MPTSVMAALALKATTLLGAAFLMLRFTSRASAASRHLIWTATFFGLIVLVFAAFALPRLPVRVLPPPEPGWLDGMTWQGQINQLGAITANSAASTATASTAGLTRTSLSQILAVIWIVGVVANAIRRFATVMTVRRFVRTTSLAIDPHLTARVRELSRLAGVHQEVTIRISPDPAIPVSWGLRRPAICLPVDACSWPDARLDAVLIHELAHVARLDVVAHAAGRIAAAIFWWHPLVWIALDRADLEREKACDDLVLACGANPSGYAADLLHLVQVLRFPTPPASMALPVVRRSHLEPRIAAILATGGNRHLRSRLSVAAAALVALTALPLGAAGLVVQRAGFDAVSLTRDMSRDLKFAHDPGARVSTASGGICPPWGSIPLTDACVVMTNMSLREMVQFGYSPSGLIPPRPIIVGGPPWIDSDRFDVVGRLKGTVPLRTPRTEELAPRVRALLSDRFQLTLHHESRDVPMYALRRGDPDAGTTPALLPATAHCLDTARRFLTARSAHPSGRLQEDIDRSCLHEMGAGYIRSGAITLPQFAGALSNRFNRIVRDETALRGAVQLNLTWSTGSPESIFTSIEQQLRLRLVPITGAADVLVIDQARFAQEGDGSRSVENSGRR
jgi:uncharacterized protein (TIGR03435 family)